jgi:hypothetical protein
VTGRQAYCAAGVSRAHATQTLWASCGRHTDGGNMCCRRCYLRVRAKRCRQMSNTALAKMPAQPLHTVGLGSHRRSVRVCIMPPSHAGVPSRSHDHPALTASSTSAGSAAALASAILMLDARTGWPKLRAAPKWLPLQKARLCPPRPQAVLAQAAHAAGLRRAAALATLIWHPPSLGTERAWAFDLDLERGAYGRDSARRACGAPDAHQ